MADSPTDSAADPSDDELLALLLNDAPPSGDTPGIPLRSKAHPLELSFAQQRLWFLQQLEPTQTAYNISAAVRLHGPLDQAHLTAALAVIVQRHEVLRTTFPQEDGTARAVLHADAIIPIEVIPTTEEQLPQHCLAASARPFDLSVAPLLRLTLLPLGPTEHGVILVMHHIVSDAWSMENLVRELGVTYAAIATGTEPTLPALPIQYGDFAAWQRQQLDAGVRVSQLNYWREKLANPPELDLPTDFSRPVKPDYTGDTIRFQVPAEIAQGLRTLMAATESTFFATMLAAGHGWLSRLTRQSDVILGAPVANRGAAELEPLMGFFVNTLALRGRLQSDMTFRDLLQAARQTALDGFAHQDLPFEDIVRAVMPERDGSRNPLFQVMLTADSGPAHDLSLGELGIEAIEVPTAVAKFDLTLSLQMSGTEVAGALEFATTLFTPATAQRFVDQFLFGLTQFVGAPDIALDQLPRMSLEETTTLADWGAGPTPAYPQSSIPVVFTAAAAAYPDKIALSLGETKLTYRELDRRANQLAHVLQDHGVGANVPVGVGLERSVDLVVTLLGVLKAGGAYLAVDPAYPAERIDQMVTAAACPLLLIGATPLPPLASGVKVLSLSAMDEARLAAPATPPPLAPQPNDLAYISFTSGSTGRPKGVAVPHRAVLRLVHGGDFADFGPDEVFLLLAPIAFDASTLELWGPLLHGGRLVIMPPGHLALEHLGHVLRTEAVTTLWLTSGLFNLMVDEQLADLRGIKQLLAGGDALSVPHVARALAELPRTRLINGYGPTENTTFTCCHRITSADLSAGSISIGKPIAHTRVLILDEQQIPVPPGVSGELYTGGDGLAHGYIGQPELTAQVFIDDPARPGQKLYRTGDHVRWRFDGTLEFRGRVDRQVKIRGHRIELTEVEAALAALPEVTAAAALVQEGPKGKRLIGYAAPQLEAADLQDILRTQVPEYLVPSTIVTLPALPLTANGKIDRDQLPAPRATASGAGDMAPRTPTEQQVAEIWCGVLAIPEISTDANYFASGGDSIGAIQVASRLRRIGWQVKVADLFQFPTVTALAAQLDRTAGSKPSPAYPTLQGAVPATPAQAWFLRHFETGRQHFNQAVLLHPRSPQKVTSLQTAVSALWRHHDALRTVERGTGLEILPAHHDIPLEVVTVENESDRLSHTERVHSEFDLKVGPLVRVVLYQLPSTQRLLIVAHHLVVDGVSWRLLVEDLSTALAQTEAGRSIDLGPRPLPISQWVESLVPADHDGDYWDPFLTEDPGAWPTPISDSPNRFGDTTTLDARLSSDLTQNLLTRAQHAFQTDVEDLLLLALGRALQRWHHGANTQVMMEGHGRESRPGVPAPEDTVGWFTSLHPFRLVLVSDDPITQLKALKEARRVIPHHGTTFGPRAFLMEGPEFDRIVHAPLSFNYLGRFDDAPETMLAFAEESSGTPIGPDVIRLQEIDAGAAVTGGAMGLSLTFGRHRYDEGAIQGLLDDWIHELARLIEICGNRNGVEATPADFTSKIFRLSEYEAMLQREGWAATEVEDVARLSPMQAGLLFQSVFDETSSAYFVQMAYRLRGPMDAPAFREAWIQLAQRHTILRTSFLHEDVPEPLQIVWRHRSPPVEIVDLRHLGETEQQTRIADHRAADLARPFDLAHDPLWRVTVWQLADDLNQIGWSYHHVLLDGWSLGLVHRDLFALYTGEAQLEPSVPYRDYVRWLEQTPPAAARTFWTDYLAGYEATSSVPHDPLNQGPSSHAEYTTVLGVELSNALRTLAADSGATLATVLQAAWGVLLRRLNRTDDVVFGAIVSGRPASLSGVERMVGLFICAVPVRIHCDENTSFSDLISNTQADALAAEPHHHLPLPEIQTLTPLGRELFDHLLVFENYPLDRTTASNPGHELVIEHVEAHDRTHYEFDLTIDPSESITLRFGHERSVFGDEQIARLADRFQTLLNGLAATPSEPLHHIDDVSATEQNRVTSEFNQNAQPLPAHATLVDLLNEGLARHAGKIAVVQNEESLTYAELHRRADQLASALQIRGAGPEFVVGIYADRNPAMIAAVLGVLKSGAAYLPLDPLYPAERLRGMLDDSGAGLVVTTGSSRELTAAIGNNWGVLSLAELSARPTALALQVDLKPHHLAYTIYTSGSTGRPKGVAVEHHSLVNAAIAWRVGYGIGNAATPPCILQMASLSFDVFMGDFIRALTNGGSLIICDADTRVDPEGLVEMLQKYRITQFESTPGLILPLMEHVHAAGLSLPDLELLILGSDTLRAEDYRQLVKRFGGNRRILNSYGVTEATIDTCFYEESDPGTEEGNESTPIGKPLANQRVYVLDPQGRAAGIGVPGELFIGGEGVARGYHQRPELTAERFPTMDPGDGRQRLYRTGDLARWRSDGTLEFLGRGDRQVKIRGVRIEPGEIETSLRECPDVVDAVVDTRTLRGNLELVAYIVPSSPEQTDASCWREHLRTTLSAAMVPTHWVTVERIPLSPNGKVDRRALPDPESVQENNGQAVVAPRTPLEASILELWQAVLQIPQSSVTDDFFACGGHSLKAMQLLSRIHRELAVKVPMRAFFDDARVEGLARIVAAGQDSSSASGLSGIPTATPAPHYPLSFAQQRLWLLHQLGGESAYNMPEAYRVSGHLDPAALAKAITGVVARHEALRTAFNEFGGDPVQTILTDVDYQMVSIDLSAQPDAEDRAREMADTEAAKPFDLRSPPLLRTVLIKLAPDRWIYLQTIHHIVGDGWSGNVLYREIFALYEAASTGASDPLPPLRLHYKDFAAWQKNRGWTAEESYWRSALQGAPSALRLPYDFTPKGDRDFRGDHLVKPLSPKAVAALRAVAQNRRTTVANALLAVFDLLLFQITKQDDFCIGMSIANRNHPDLENLIGFFVNLLPVRVRLDDSMDFETLLDQVVSAADAAVEHQDYPFDLMVQQLNPDRAANRQPLLNIVYAFQNFSDVHIDIGATAPGEAATNSPKITPFEHTFHTSKFDLTLFAEDDGRDISLTLEYDTGLFKVATIQRYLDLLDRFACMISPPA